MHKKLHIHTLLYIIIGLVSCLLLMPIIIMILTSLKTKTQILSNAPSFFFIPTFTHYQHIFQDYSRLSFFLNSIYIGITSTIATLFIGAMAAYSMVKSNFYGKKILANSLIFVRIIPPAVLTIPIFLIWTFQFNLSNSLLGVIIVYTAMNLPFVIWLLQGFIIQTPHSLHDAARLDGASEWQIFTKIILPIIKPGLAAAGIFVFRIVWNEFILAMVLTNYETRTMPVNISLLNGSHNVEWGEIMALGVLIAIPPIIFAFMASRHIISGMTAGAVKG